MERILVPIDFSQLLLITLDDAVESRKNLREARLTILYVVERGYYGSPVVSRRSPQTAFFSAAYLNEGLPVTTILFLAAHDAWRKEAMTRWSQIEGSAQPLGAVWLREEGSYNFALYSRHATSVDAPAVYHIRPGESGTAHLIELSNS